MTYWLVMVGFWASMCVGYHFYGGPGAVGAAGLLAMVAMIVSDYREPERKRRHNDNDLARTCMFVVDQNGRRRRRSDS